MNLKPETVQKIQKYTRQLLINNLIVTSLIAAAFIFFPIASEKWVLLVIFSIIAIYVGIISVRDFRKNPMVIKGVISKKFVRRHRRSTNRYFQIDLIEMYEVTSDGSVVKVDIGENQSIRFSPSIRMFNSYEVGTQDIFVSTPDYNLYATLSEIESMTEDDLGVSFKKNIWGFVVAGIIFLISIALVIGSVIDKFFR
ncbi:hypothetical protein JW887_01320 [Candidatus Dojkabacteria bacterium]|nr:hypothetical protein [Candidatus Dojkabacteria bacterium]